MNSRNFFKSLATVAAGFSILPSAVTYARAVWKPSRGSGIYVMNPAWEHARYEVELYLGGCLRTYCYIIPVMVDRRSNSRVLRMPAEGDMVRVRDLVPIRYDSPEDFHSIPPKPPISPFVEL